LAFGLIESTLALRTGRFAGVSRYEVKRAQAFPGGAGGYLLPNTWGSTVKPYDGGLCRTTPAVVGMKARIAFVGRLAPQKDPGFLLGALGLLADSGVPPQDHFDITWYGGGDDEVKIKLESFGVRVTGWMPHAEVMQGLRNSTLYVHTGAWEGFPMSVIEAAVAGCPLLLRSINAFDDYGFPTRSMFHAPRELAEVLVNWSKGVPDLLAAAESAKDVVLAACSPTSQRGALLSLYASAEREPAMALGRHRQ
jgi:hypothetical protein